MAVSGLRDGDVPRLVAPSSLVVVGSLAMGVATAYGQEWLPQQLGSLANSVGSWALVAFGLALLATAAWLAAVFGSVSLLGLLAGYVVGADVRGYPSSTTTIAFWVAASLVAGPLLGLSSYWVKTGRDLLAATGVGAVSGVLVGEGVYGLTSIADTTYPPYWWGQIVVGLALLGIVASRRPLGIRAGGFAVGVTVVVAVVFVIVYRLDLLTLLP